MAREAKELRNAGRESSTRATLRLKLQPPKALSHQIERAAITRLLAAAPAATVILFRAPPGFGKTTAMCQYHERLVAQQRPTAWITFDKSDNDASRLLLALRAALDMLFPGGTREGADALSSRVTIGDIALDVFERMGSADEAFTLFMDEVETLHDPSALSIIRDLIDHLPQTCQIVMGSRTVPNMPLGRLRARGQLVEVGAQQLRFSFDEAAQFLTDKRALTLSIEDLQRLHSKTEGWIAALWLASVALNGTESRSHFIARFAGTDQSIADYLAEEVLARQPTEVRTFLLRTSILHQFDAALCQRFLPEFDVDRILRDIASTELPLIPVESTAGSFRYHSLFTEYLQAQLSGAGAEDEARLHERASRAFEEIGRPVPAIEHAVAANDVATAVRLLEQQSEPLLAQGRMRLLERWLSALPAPELARRPALQVIHLWATCFTRGPWEALERLASGELEANPDAGIVAHIRALRPTALAMMDRYEEAHEAGRTALSGMPTSAAFPAAVLANTMATVATVVGEESEARRLIEAARAGSGEGGSAFNRMYSESDEGILDLRAGRLRLAIARFRIAASSTQEPGVHTRGNAFAGVPYALAVYETGDLARAAHLMQIYLPLVRAIALPDHAIIAHVVLARIAFARGEVDQTFEYLSTLEYLGHQRKLPRVIVTAKLERARILLQQGHPRAAREELDRADDAAVWNRVQQLNYLANEVDTMELARLRWDIHAGNARTALARIGSATTHAQARGRALRIMKLQVFEALALQRLSDPDAARAAMAAPLRLGAQEGFVRILLDEGTPAALLIGESHRHRLETDQYRDEPFLGEFVSRLVETAGGAVLPAGPTVPQTEPGLTPKEVRVLQLLADGYSNMAIADKMYVSVSTVRTHLRNINVKLDAHNRTQAVAVARKFGIVR